MAVEDLGSYTLGGINVGLAVGIGLINPLLLQFDLFLTGQFGFGPFMADVQAQFNAAIAATFQLSIGLINPLAAIQALLAASMQLIAALNLALSFPLALPTISAQLSVVVALSASLSLKLGGLSALLSAGLAVKIPVVRFVGKIAGALSAGPAHLLSFTGQTLSASGSAISAEFNAGLGPDDPLLPSDLVDGIIIVTKDPLVFQALGLIMKTS
jgi:hypothetical protein